MDYLEEYMLLLFLPFCLLHLPGSSHSHRTLSARACRAGSASFSSAVSVSSLEKSGKGRDVPDLLGIRGMMILIMDILGEFGNQKPKPEVAVKTRGLLQKPRCAQASFAAHPPLASPPPHQSRHERLAPH